MPAAPVIAFLLDELCTRFGFCLRTEERKHLEAAPPTDPDAFARAVFQAEGVDPDSDRQLYQEVREVVRRAFSPGVPGSE